MDRIAQPIGFKGNNNNNYCICGVPISGVRRFNKGELLAD